MCLSEKFCKECLEKLDETNIIPGYEDVIECSYCGYPNAPGDWFEI